MILHAQYFICVVRNACHKYICKVCIFLTKQESSLLDSNREPWRNALVSILTIEEKAGILDAQSVGGHTGIVPIILFSDIGNHENCGSAKNLDVDALGIGQPGDERVK